MRWTVFGLSCLLIYLQCRLWIGSGSMQEVIRLSHVVSQQTETIQAMTARNAQLDAEVRALKQHPKALEERARSELGMIKRGESFYVVIEPR